MESTSVVDTYLGELVAVLLGRIWHDRKPTLAQFNQLRAFVNRCVVPTQLTYPTVIEGLVYVHRLRQRFPDLSDVEGLECSIFLVGLILANKHLDDCNFTNKVWSQVSGIDRPKVNSMEMEYLQIMDYETYIQPDYLVSFANEMQNMAEDMGLHTLLIECASEIASNLCCVHDPVIRERLGVGTPPLGRNGFADMAAGCVSASTEIGHSTRRMGSRVTVSSARNVHESGSRNVEASSNAVGASNIGPGRSRVALEQNAPHASTLNRLRRTPTASTSSLLTHRLARIFIGSGTAKSTSSLATPTGSGIRLQQDANRLAVITKNMSHGHSLGAMLQPRNNVPQPFDGKHIGECTLTVELSSMMLGIPVAGKAAATCNDIAPI